MVRQAQIAIDTADVIVLMVDIKTGLTAADEDVAVMLRKSAKPVVVAVNKVDSIGQTPPEAYEFYNLGMGEIYPVSSIHGLGMGELLDAIYDYFPEEKHAVDEDDYIKVAVIGKPNSGKSSIINRILGEERVIVSDIPGTTRDAIDTFYEAEGKNTCLLTLPESAEKQNRRRYRKIQYYQVMDGCGQS